MADEGTGTINFPVDRTGQPEGEATVRYTTCPTPLKDDAAATAACTGFVGTAVAGVDYTATSGTVTFADGEADPVNVPVAIIDDRIDEVDETFYFVIFAPVNLDIPTGKGDAVGTIRDDDPAPVLSVDSPEVGEDEGPLVFSLTLDRPSARLLEVPWRTRPDTAQAGEDYTHVSGVAVFAPGNTAGEVAVPLTDDEVAEDDETLMLEVDAIPNLKISGAGTFPGLIEDDDNPDGDPTVNAVGEAIAEDSADGEVEFTVRLTRTSRTAIEVVVATLDGTAKSNGTGVGERDYVAIERQTLVFKAGSRVQTVRVAINDDDVWEEGPEKFQLDIVSSTGAVVGTDGDATISDDEARPEPFFSDRDLYPKALRLNEGDGTVAMPVSLSLKSHRAFPVEVGAQASGDSAATAGVDFEDSLPSLTFQPGEISGRSTAFTIIDDNDVEEDEVLELFVYEPGHIAKETLWVQIVDDDLDPDISVGNSRGGEGSKLAFGVTLSAGSVNEITARWRTADGSAKADEGDYRTANGLLTFAPGQTRKEVRVAALQDELDEPAESFHVVITNPTNATLADDVGEGMIVDDDPPVVCIPIVDEARAVESDDNIEFVIKLDKPSGQRVSVNYATANVSARSGEDYSAKTGTAVFQRGETQVRVPVALIDDVAMESTEQLRLNLSGYSHVTPCDPSSLLGTIFDDDSSMHALSIEGGTGNEADDTLDFVVTLEPASTDTVTVGYATRDDGATGGQDFVAQTGELTFAAGETSKTVAVELLEDERVEGDEKFKVVLSDPENAHLAPGGRSRAVGTIIDNDTAPTISVEAASGVEGTPGTVTFPVRLSKATGSAVSVRYQVTAGTANAGGDFVSAAGILSIPAESVEAELVVELTDNELSERDETFAVEIHSPKNATLSQAVATGTIVDDEAPPSFTRPSQDRYRENSTIRWTLSLTQESASSEYPIELRVYSEHGTASSRDYTSFDERFRLAAGVRSTGLQRIASIRADSIDEDDETFTARFEVVDGHVSPDAWSVPVVILDIDDPPSIGVSRPRGREGATADFEVKLSTTSVREITVQYATQHGTTSADDLGEVQGTLVFSPGQQSKRVRVALHADGVNEAEEETFSLTLSSPTNAWLTSPRPHRDWYDNYSWSGTAEGVVLDQDAEPAVSIADAEATEGTSGLDFAVTMSRPNYQDVLVDYTIVAGTALEAEDYTGSSYRGRLTFTQGETRQVLSLAVVDDDVAELTETLKVQLSSPRYAVITEEPEVALARRTAVGTILDDDQIEVTVGDESGDEGETVTFTVSLTGGVTDAEVVAKYALSDGTALSGSDYEPASGSPTGSLRFAPGVTSATVEVELLDDDVDEAPENFVLTLTGVTSGSARVDPGAGRAMGTINDTDVAPTVSIAEEPVVEEGGMLAFPVSLGQPSGQTVTVSYATSDDTATAGEDYETGGGALSFQPGETSLTVEVAVLDDMVDEPDETLFLSLTEAMNASLGVATATGTILDNDETSSVIALRADPASLSEDRGAVAVAVTATLDASARPEATTVTVSVTGSGDIEAVDFEGVDDFRIVIEAGARDGVGTFTLTPEDDGVDEKDETLAVTGASDLPVTGTSVMLADDDPTSTSIVLTAVPSQLSENDGATEVAVTATLDFAARAFGTTVNVAVVGSGAPDAVDFADVPDFTITIPAGETSVKATFTVTPEDDLAYEPEETLSVGGTSDLPVTGTSVSLVDDDKQSTHILLSADPSSVSEGADAAPVAVTATLDAGARTVETLVAVTVTGSGTNEAVDYAPVPDFEIVIGAGETSGTRTFTLEPEDDSVAESNETLTVSGTSVLEVTSATVAITDDDADSTMIDLSAFPNRVTEGAGPTAVTITASLNRAARQAATMVRVKVTGSGEARAVDFAAVPDVEIVIGAGETSGTGTFTLEPEDDALNEVDEQLSITGTSDLPVTGMTVALVDDDEPSTRILLSAEPGRVLEDAGPTPVAVTATFDKSPRQQPTRVTVSVSGSDARGAVDFLAVADFAITIAAGESSGTGTFTLTPLDDATVRGDETLVVSGTSDLPVMGAAVALVDDDEASSRILLSAVPVRISEGAGPTRVAVTAAMDRGLRQEATTVTVSVGGSGDPKAVGFHPVADFAITIPAHAANGTGRFTLTPEDDRRVEVDETLTLSGASDLPVTSTGVLLADNDEASTRIILSVVPSRVSESAGPTPVVVTASLDRGLRQEATTVTVSAAGSGDPDAVDFDAVADFDIIIEANALSGTGSFTLTLEGDAVVERDEVLTVSGASDLPVTPVDVLLADDDEASTRIVLSVVPSRVSEGAGPTRVTVTAALDRGLRQEATTVTVWVSGGGDPDAVDFAPIPDLEIVIPANTPNGTATFTVVPEDDLIVEADEMLTVSGVSDLPVTPATMELLDDDEASGRIVLSADPARVSEGDGPVAVTVTASLDRGLRLEGTTVTVSVTGGGDPNAVDFAAVTDFEIVIPANAPNGSGTFTVVPEDDVIVEADELLTVSGVADLPVSPAILELLDDDEASGRIVLSADPARVSEGDGPVAVTVTASLDRGLRLEATTVTVSVTGGGDPNAVDFAAVTDFEIVIPANAPNGSGTFTVVPEDDVIVEADELLTVSGVADLPVSPAILELLDDDEASGRIVLSADPARVSEGDGPVAVTVTASLDRGLRLEATTVTVSVSGSGDPDAVDFDAVADFDIIIEANAPSGTESFTLTLEDDAVVERDEVLTVSGASDLPVLPATLTLRDDDETVSRVLSIADAEASESAGEMPFVVALDGPSAVEVTVGYETADPVGSAGPVAGAGIDYESASGTLTFAPGEVSRTIGVSVIDDSLDEPDETFALVLSDLRGAALGRGSALGTIRDDDEPPALSIAGDTGREDVGELVFSVTLMARAPTEVTVNYATMDDTAIAGDDYGRVEGTLTFAPGETAKTIRVAVVDDAVDEADEESFAVTLSGPSGATLAHALATGVIRDDDEPPALSVADAAGDEDVGALEFAVVLSAPSGIEVSASYATADGTATAGGDYAAATGTLMFAPGEVSRMIAISVLDDSLDEPDETFTLVLADPRGATLGRGSALGTIRDDDEPPALSIAGDTGPEDVGELVFSITLMARAPTEVTVNYATMDDTAIAGDDYGPVEGTLTFAPGETARTIRVAVVDDALDEADEESFAVTLSGPSGATLAHSLATGVIRDNDEPPALSVADAAGDEDVGALEFAVALSAASGIEVSASYATKDGTATAGGDYEAATGTLMFAPGEVSQTIRVAILDDALHEADEETFEMTLARLANATAADVSATGTIRDDDLAPPAVAGDLPAALLCVGGAPYELDLADYFAGKELRFSADSSTPQVATTALDGSMLTVAPASEGESSVTVTASNDAGSASGSIGVRVVADPAELEAVESVLASIGRAVLTGVTESVRARFGPRNAIGEQSASTNIQRGRTQVVPGASAVLGNQWPGPPMHGTRSGGWDGSGFFEPQVSGDDWFETMNRTYRRGMAPFSFSLDSAQSVSTGPAWAVWGRADAHRFESGIDGSSHDGTLTAVHLGADARVGDWLAGVSVARSAAQADYRFERSVDACGGGGVGEGMVDADLTSVHPYVGRQIGRGSVWATLGAGGGEVSVERCETGQRNEADLSMRLAALGGRHPFAGGERIEVSVVEEISVLDLTTGDAPGPVGDRSVRVGQARLGLEAAGVAPADCDCSLTTFVRAFARGDWGDGATGAGLELAAGVRFRNLPRRLGIDAGIRALAVHSAEDAREHSANLTFSILPKADGTGWQASLAWRRGASDARLAALGGNSPWTAPGGSLPGAEAQWIAQNRFGYGIRLPRGSATPFVEFDAGHSRRGGARFGVRHEFGDRAREIVVEWGIEPSSFGSAESRILLEALGRF